jgi:2-oxoisovalerate dehydrogenase E1 component
VLDEKFYKEALFIRRVEETFLSLFSVGQLNGTVHTCIGQEFSAVCVANQLIEGDFIFSNHRCHGHYISFTKDVRGLILELTGKKEGVCGGIGGSQHLCNKNFYSNGIQGGILPVAAGMSLAGKLNDNNSIGVVFIGDGTLGEGVVYETLNLISKWEIPLLVVCENNFYAQSTKISHTLAGDILLRAESFGLKTFKSSTECEDDLFSDAGDSIAFVREHKKPVFHLIETYRLNAHSKGDDDRNPDEIEAFRVRDPLNRFQESHRDLYDTFLNKIDSEINEVVSTLNDLAPSDLDHYLNKQKEEDSDTIWTELEVVNERVVNLINEFFIGEMESNSRLLFIGEDVLSPYGGAFKIARDLSAKFPRQVFSTPISEAAIVGISNGLALGGFKPFVEIMFGDFVTLTLDQIINHASKFYHMYNRKVKCPVVIRTPMGGGRGYGPTHSQTLDKFLIGIDNIKTVALNTLINPKIIFETVSKEEHPVILIENKLDYGRTIAKIKLKNYSLLRTNSNYPLVKLTPKLTKPDFTLVTYGGNVTIVIEAIEKLFYEVELLGEVIVLSCIHPISISDFREILQSSENSRNLFVVEEGSSFAGWGSEIVARVSESSRLKIETNRISSLPVPIPSSSGLERQVLVSVESIVSNIKHKLSQ